MRFSCVDMNIRIFNYFNLVHKFKTFVIFAVGGASRHGHGHEQWGIELDPGDHQ